MNSVSPGGIKSDQPQNFIDAYTKKTLGNGMLLPKDITSSIIFLLSSSSNYINGQDFVIDDGFCL